MQVISFPVKKNADINILLEVIRKFGYEPILEEEFDKQMKSRKNLVKYSRSYKRLNINESEVNKLVSESHKK